MATDPITPEQLKAALGDAVQQIKEYVDERVHDAETRLLRAFGDYQAAHEVRFRKIAKGI